MAPQHQLTIPRCASARTASVRGVFCSDYGPQRDYAKLAAIGDMLAKTAPRFVWKFWNSSPIANASAGVGVCVGWPREAANPPHLLKVGPHRDVMVANPTHDPPTPLTNAVSVYLQIPEARLLIADVDGHQSLLLSKCAYETARTFPRRSEIGVVGHAVRQMSGRMLLRGGR